MGARSSGRQAALQMLFAADTANHPADRIIRDFWRQFPGEAEGRDYGDALTRKVLLEKEALDERIQSVATNWRMERMTPVDRNILRLGAYELVHATEIPRAVIIDEAVELAKRYGADGSSAFVNGVLDKLADSCRSKED